MSAFPVFDLLGEASVARGLLAGDPRLRQLVTHSPLDPDALLASARAAAARELDRPALAAALDAGLRDLGAPEQAIAAAQRLGRPGVVAVVTGQQPGLLGGPLMVLVKALAAAAVARRIEAAGIPAVPVFWHASEDHDHGEADHVGWPVRGGVERLRLALAEDRRVLSMTPLPEAAAALVERVLEALPEGPGRDVLTERLSTGAPGLTFGDWVGRLLARVLGAQGIVVVEPHRLRRLAVAVARHEFTRPGELHAGVERAQRVVSEAGFDPPLDLRRPDLLFHVDPVTGVRSPMARLRAEFGMQGSGIRAPAAEWLSGLEADPAWASWNVAARVLAQDVALPVAAQICGPAELGYVALMREGHAALGVPQPIALLRPGVTLVDRAVRRACQKLGITPEDVVLRGAPAFPVAALEAAPALERLREAIEALPEGGSAASRRRRAELARQADLFADALRRESEEVDTVRTERVETVTSGLRPLGRPMERVISFLPWYARGGDDFVTGLLARMGTGDPVHHVLLSEDL